MEPNILQYIFKKYYGKPKNNYRLTATKTAPKKACMLGLCGLGETKQARENRLIPHHKAHKTKSLLASAVDLLTEEDARLQLVLIAAALED